MHVILLHIQTDWVARTKESHAEAAGSDSVPGF